MLICIPAPRTFTVGCTRKLLVSIVLSLRRTYVVYVGLSYLLYPFMFLSSDYFDNTVRVGLLDATRLELLYDIHFGTVV